MIDPLPVPRSLLGATSLKHGAHPRHSRDPKGRFNAQALLTAADDDGAPTDEFDRFDGARTALQWKHSSERIATGCRNVICAIRSSELKKRFLQC